MENSQHSAQHFPGPLPNFSVPPPPFYPRYPQPLSQNYPHSMHHMVQADQNSRPCMPMPRFPQPSVLVQTGYSEGSNVCKPENDVLWVEHFLSKLGKSNSILTNLCDEKKETINICEAQELVGTSICVVKELKKLEIELIEKVSTFSPNEWQQKLLVMQSMKGNLIQCLNKFSNPTIERLKSSLNKRTKKRRAHKRQRAIRKEANEQERSRRQQLHRTIDTWLDTMQLSVEKVKTEESLKCQADLVLCDVTQKQGEARRQQALLSALLKLRQLRVQTASSRGERVSSEQVKIFNNVTEHMQALWVDQLKGYNLEEKGLRVMLEEETQEQKRVLSVTQQHFAKWQRLLFGRNASLDNPYTIAERDMDAFVAVRRDWDKFLAPVAVQMASAIPIGWVVPAKPSSSQWEKLLATDNQ